MFCDGVWCHLQFCLDHLSCVKMAAYLQSRKQKSGVGGGWQSCCFWPNILGEKRKCVVVRCCNATASSFVARILGEVFAYLHAVAIKHHNSMRNWLFSLSGRILCEQSLWCQRKWWACPWLCSSPV
jgi:hypothetical protein